jgi:hypothetical protein
LDQYEDNSDSLSEYRDENAEPDEVDEIVGNEGTIVDTKVKQL